MKKVVLGLVLSALTMISCSDKKPTETAVESNVMLEEPKTIDSAAMASKSETLTPEAEGKELLEGMDCLSCHKVDAKLVGPSYQDVAAKYTEADIDMLAQKIIDGGKGNWGDIPMTPHSGMSKENAQKMVKYILSLKK